MNGRAFWALVANASEANKAEVEEGARLLAQAKQAADTARQIFDAAVAARIGWIGPGLIIDERSLQRVLKRSEVAEAAEKRANLVLATSMRHPTAVLALAGELRAAGYRTEARVLAVERDLSRLATLVRYERLLELGQLPRFA